MAALLVADRPYAYMNVKEGEKYDPMKINSETENNMVLEFRFGKGYGEEICYVYIKIGGKWKKNRKATSEIEITDVGVHESFKGKGWCKPLIIYSLKRSIQELSKNFWTKNEELKKEPIIGNCIIVSENPVAANRCYTYAFEAIGFRCTNCSEPTETKSGIHYGKKMVTQSLKFESEKDYNPDWLNKDIPVPDEPTPPTYRKTPSADELEVDSKLPSTFSKASARATSGGSKKKRRRKIKRRKKRKRRKKTRKQRGGIGGLINGRPILNHFYHIKLTGHHTDPIAENERKTTIGRLRGFPETGLFMLFVVVEYPYGVDGGGVERIRFGTIVDYIGPNLDNIEPQPGHWRDDLFDQLTPGEENAAKNAVKKLTKAQEEERRNRVERDKYLNIIKSIKNFMILVPVIFD